MKLSPTHQWPTILPLLSFLLLPLFGPVNSLNRDGVLLLSFRFTVVGDPLSILSSWNFNDDTPCNWRGVTCSNATASAAAGRVTGLSLPNSELHGSISPDLGSLDQLQTLNLSSNSFNGSLPGDLFRANQLRVLDLSGNLLSGELPETIGEFQSLELLNISYNAFSGQLPKHLAGLGNLSVISLRSNNFSGEIPANLSRVQVLDLSSNSIKGSLPARLGGKILQYFNVSHNNISGEIPTEFGREIPANATLDLSYNNLTGAIPDSDVFLSQETTSFLGNPGICGEPSNNPCPIPSSPTSFPQSQNGSSPPAFAAIPKSINSQPAEGAAVSPSGRKSSDVAEGKSGLRPATIAVIVAGDVAGIGILALVLLLVYRHRRSKVQSTVTSKPRDQTNGGQPLRAWSSPASSTSSETKGITKWSCLRKQKAGDEETSSSDEEEASSETEESQNAALSSQQARNDEQQGKAAAGTLVTVDGDRELEVETLLKASAYILGASGPSILYKAVLEDGTALAVRRIGEGAAERLKDFENQIRSVAKVASSHPNLVRLRGFYWGPDEKLIIYEFVPNGSLANARYRKGGSSSPCHLPWEFRLKIAKGVARGLSFLHDKKHVHGNLKPTNVLLGLDMEPKIADFGLDRLNPAESSYKTGWSTRHFGSKRSTASRDSFQDLNFGPTPSPTSSSIGSGSPYHPPESLRSLKPNAKWDVYSFGVVLLELLTGKVVGPDDVALWMGLVMGEEKSRVLRLADVAIRADLEGDEDALLACLKLGCCCAAAAPQKRPSMKEALQVLEKLPASSSSPYF